MSVDVRRPVADTPPCATTRDFPASRRPFRRSVGRHVRCEGPRRGCIDQERPPRTRRLARTLDPPLGPRVPAEPGEVFAMLARSMQPRFPAIRASLRSPGSRSTTSGRPFAWTINCSLGGAGEVNLVRATGDSPPWSPSPCGLHFTPGRWRSFPGGAVSRRAAVFLDEAAVALLGGARRPNQARGVSRRAR
jgi:hypothetical protein